MKCLADMIVLCIKNYRTTSIPKIRCPGIGPLQLGYY